MFELFFENEREFDNYLEKMEFPTTEFNGMSGQYPGYKWYSIMFKDNEVQVYVLD